MMGWTIEEREVVKKDLHVGSFGIVDEDGREHIINWKVNGWRKDLRHGAMDPEPPSEYGKSLFDSMFKGW